MTTTATSTTLPHEPNRLYDITGYCQTLVKGKLDSWHVMNGNKSFCTSQGWICMNALGGNQVHIVLGVVVTEMFKKCLESH